ncbi:aspartyl-phosphate phosphatase Spo0E family protein [Sporosarcina luteola]|uniref:aspartyl-phosphate phosphatase Spo0E family protein n=1 Tax=Sporosarcina luteola TaxID=582850 RepID=UPI00204049F2|nr:aspartyl-phosphate phosphatase Spo0E family protein [Sporosarcina luteola]MCM3710111.1 aspartyl-phosphate phosphatase Spo0E family protein [Sporosarcina luteola]
MKHLLEAQIETTRKELITVAGKEGLSSIETLLISEMLDRLINEYNSLEEMPGLIEWIEQ